MKSKKNSCIVYIIAVLLLISGLVVFIYPKITDLFYKNKVEHLKEDFINQQVEQSTDIKNNINVNGLYEKLIRENEKLFQEHQKDLKDPFSYQQPNVDLSMYGINDNIIGFINIPVMGIELPIYLGANNQNMKLGAVHLTQTSYPIGGKNTNSILAAHRGYSKTAMFRDIQKLKVGDKVYIKNFKEDLIYKVVETRIIKPDDIDELLIQPEKDLITLVTCHPLRHNSHRYVVFCERVTN